MIGSSRLHSKMLETCRVEIDELPASIPWIVFDKARTVVKLFHTRSVASQFHGRKALNSLGWLSCCFAYTSLHTDVDPRTLFETTLDLVRQTQPWRVEVFPVLRHVRIREHERVTGYSMNLDAIIFHQLGVYTSRCSVWSGHEAIRSCCRPRPSWRLESLKKVPHNIQVLLMPVSTILW